MKEFPQSGSNDFCVDFIYEVPDNNRREVSDTNVIGNLRNKGYKAKIHTMWQVERRENVSDSIKTLVRDDVPTLLIKQPQKPSGPGELAGSRAKIATRISS